MFEINCPVEEYHHRVTETVAKFNAGNGLTSNILHCVWFRHLWLYENHLLSFSNRGV